MYIDLDLQMRMWLNLIYSYIRVTCKLVLFCIVKCKCLNTPTEQRLNTLHLSGIGTAMHVYLW